MAEYLPEILNDIDINKRAVCIKNDSILAVARLLFIPMKKLMIFG